MNKIIQIVCEKDGGIIGLDDAGILYELIRVEKDKSTSAYKKVEKPYWVIIAESMK